jgi:hypothetical protein
MTPKKSRIVKTVRLVHSKFDIIINIIIIIIIISSSSSSSSSSIQTLG